MWLTDLTPRVHVNAGSNDVAFRWLSLLCGSEGQFLGNSAQKDCREHRKTLRWRCWFGGSQPPRWRWTFRGRDKTSYCQYSWVPWALEHSCVDRERTSDLWIPTPIIPKNFRYGHLASRTCSNFGKKASRIKTKSNRNINKLAPCGTDGWLLLTANFKVTWHKK